MTDRSRWQELAANPREDLETELKGWLDLSVPGDKANLAQAILALANHGGGAVLIGFSEAGGEWHEDVGPAPGFGSFTTDSVNGVVQSYADPAFHCELKIVSDATLKHAHPVVVVPGGHRVPIRARRDGPDRKHVHMNEYYIRRPGPQSAPPQSAEEWQRLIHRCVLAEREMLLDNIRAALAGEEARRSEPSLEEKTAAWETESFHRFAERLRETKSEDTYRMGYYTFSYGFAQKPSLEGSKLVDALRSVERQTGWPVWIVFDREPIAPYPIDGVIECHVFEPGQPRDPSHSDFWRASPEGLFFLLRGFQEDGGEDLRGRAKAGEALDRILPLWRVGECLLHASRMAQRLNIPDSAVHFRVSWKGLRERRLMTLFGDGFPPSDTTPPSRQDVVHSRITVDADRIRLQLTDLVIGLTQPLFSVFNFEAVSRRRVEAELARMLSRAG
jgi:hypothetical protein